MNINFLQLILFPKELCFYAEILSLIYFIICSCIITTLFVISIILNKIFLRFLLSVLLRFFKKFYGVQITKNIDTISLKEIVFYTLKIIFIGYSVFLITEYLLYIGSIILSFGNHTLDGYIYEGFFMLPLALTVLSMTWGNKYYVPFIIRQNVIKTLINYLLSCFYFQINVSKEDNLLALKYRIIEQRELISKYTRCINIEYKHSILHAIDNISKDNHDIIIIESELDQFMILLSDIYSKL